MYKLLLATNSPAIRSLFESIVWKGTGFSQPLYASNAQEAVDLLNSKAIDAIGFYLEGQEVAILSNYLHFERPSLPVFSVCSDRERQILYLKETVAVLNQIHTDMAETPYNDDMMRTMMRDELMHRLLCGEVEDFSVVERQLKLIRSHLSATRPCMVYEMDMPQGEVYMTEHHNAMERLERALRNNFFGRYVDRIYYDVAVLTPRHIRVAAIPQGGIDQDLADFERRANEHVEDSLRMIKEYLNLDINIAQKGMIPSLRAFTDDN